MIGISFVWWSACSFSFAQSGFLINSHLDHNGRLCLLAHRMVLAFVAICVTRAWIRYIQLFGVFRLIDQFGQHVRISAYRSARGGLVIRANRTLFDLSTVIGRYVQKLHQEKSSGIGIGHFDYLNINNLK